jgi:hypothetical protein
MLEKEIRLQIPLEEIDILQSWKLTGRNR